MKVIAGICGWIIIAGSPMCVFPKENVQVRHRTRARGKILQKVCSRRHFFDDFCFKVWIRIKIAGWICKKCSGAAARVTFFNVEGQGNLGMYVTFMLLENHSRTAVRVGFLGNGEFYGCRFGLLRLQKL